MKFGLKSLMAVVALSVAVVACGQPAPEPAEAPPETPQVTGPPPVPADFQPCNAMTFEQIATLIGTTPTIQTDDITGTAAEGWATCALGRADASIGPTFKMQIANFETSADASTRHSQLIAAETGAQSVSGAGEAPSVWTSGDSLVLQYANNRWVVRYTLTGATDAQARARLLAAYRWPT